MRGTNVPHSPAVATSGNGATLARSGDSI